MTDEPLGSHVLELQVSAVIEETADARSLVFSVPEGSEIPADRLRYSPGQFLTLRVPSDRTTTYQFRFVLRDTTADARAGADQSVAAGSTVTLDGTASRPTTGASFQWTQTAGPAVVLSNANTAQPSFTAPAAGNTLTFRLAVTNSNGTTDTDTVNVTTM